MAQPGKTTSRMMIGGALALLALLIFYGWGLYSDQGSGPKQDATSSSQPAPAAPTQVRPAESPAGEPSGPVGPR